MQQADNQHLDFLISQYVDGTLEGAGKKSVEQKMLLDPAARALYAEHQETQDLLDDWGNRLPLIDWNAFDAKLSEKLDAQTREQERVTIFRRRMKPVAAAAALLLAASVGYGWHAMSQGSRAASDGPTANIPASYERPHQFASLPEASGTKPSFVRFGVEEPAAQGLIQGVAAEPVYSIPENATALQSLQDSVVNGLKNVPDVSTIPNAPGAVMAGDFGNQKDEKDQQLPR
ncbi:MAG TPA: hypothetical protein VHM90_19580 [Phycisphaerae bacterium]|nr:hypothetical protein [Phycisphaerae bacterium]